MELMATATPCGQDDKCSARKLGWPTGKSTQMVGSPLTVDASGMPPGEKDRCELPSFLASFPLLVVPRWVKSPLNPRRPLSESQLSGKSPAPHFLTAKAVSLTFPWP